MKLLIKNGRIWDGEQFFYADVLTEDQTIAAIRPDIQEKATYCFDATGMTVSAGLLDMHAHFRGISADIYGIAADAACLPFGATTAVDVSAMKGNKDMLGLLGVKVPVMAFISIKEDKAVFTAAERAFENYGDQVIGLKICFSEPGAVTIKPLQQACEYARSKGLPLMVHCTDSPLPMGEIVDCLSAGDILTHPYHGGKNTAMDDGLVCFKRAREKGIWLDAGFAGFVHTDFEVLRQAFAAGFFPDTISTDITKGSAFKRGGRYGLTMCMSMARTAGMPEEAIFKAVTSTPAAAIGWKVGKLQVGGNADLCLLSYTNEPFSLTDKAGNTLENKTGYRCRMTICNGVVVYRD